LSAASESNWQELINRLMSNVQTLPILGGAAVLVSKEAYDYVIIGAGSAGCTLAARISEDSTKRVLLIEAGGSDRSPYITIPLAWGRLFGERMFDWNYNTMPEPNLNNRVLDCARGRVIGGSSSTNAMAYGRGHPDDYDRWAEAGLDGWSYDDVLPYFRKSESWEDGPSEFRGGDGPLTTRRGGLDDPIVEAWFAAGKRLGYPFSDDSCGAQQEGFAIPQWTVRKGRRCSAAVAYLRPALKRGNLVLVSHAIVDRIVFDGTRAVGVTYKKNGQTVTVKTSGEIILCAGAINSPPLLQRSGIGAEDELRDIGVEPVSVLPGVGKNLQDHMSVPMEYERKGQGVFQRDLRYDRFLKMLAEGFVFGTGKTTGLPMGVQAFLKSSIAERPCDFVLLFRASAPRPLQYPPFTDPGVDGVGYRIALMQPKSRGWVKALSTDPEAAPEICQNFLSHPDDIKIVREGLQLVRAMNADQDVAPHIAAEHLPGAHVQTDAEFDDFIRENATTVHHPIGSCKMGLQTDDMAVVDRQLNVFGTTGLRVVDASVMPTIVSGPTNGPTIMLAEKAADIIRGNTAKP